MASQTKPPATQFSLTVLGASPAWTNPGGACSGYLVTAGGDHVLVDCGFAVFSRLRARLPLDDLTAVVISHLHPDHFMDLVPLRYGLKYGGLRADSELPLYGPPGSQEYFGQLGTALVDEPHFFDETFRLLEYETSRPLEIGSLTFRFQLVQHYIRSYAMDIRAGRKLVFSSDAAPCQGLVDVAGEADLFLCEAAIERREQDDPDPSRRGHMTASEAAQTAREAGVARLLLTHYPAHPSRNSKVLAEARQVFGGTVDLAEEGKTYRV